jgi:ATP/maltotriose-dependent transcriptional regulator MalT
MNRRIRMSTPYLRRDEQTMTASHASLPAPRIPTVTAARATAADRAQVELRRLLLSQLALDVHPQHLAGVVIRLCAALSPMLVRPAVSVGVRSDLSDRELQVLIGMAGGSPNAQIGRELHLSEDTVKTYARRLYANLGVRDRAHAVARGFQLGILVVGEPGDNVGAMAPPRSIGGTAPVRELS